VGVRKQQSYLGGKRGMADDHMLQLLRGPDILQGVEKVVRRSEVKRARPYPCSSRLCGNNAIWTPQAPSKARDAVDSVIEVLRSLGLPPSAAEAAAGPDFPLHCWHRSDLLA